MAWSIARHHESVLVAWQSLRRCAGRTRYRCLACRTGSARPSAGVSTVFTTRGRVSLTQPSSTHPLLPLYSSATSARPGPPCPHSALERRGTARGGTTPLITPACPPPTPHSAATAPPRDTPTPQADPLAQDDPPLLLFYSSCSLYRPSPTPPRYFWLSVAAHTNPLLFQTRPSTGSAIVKLPSTSTTRALSTPS